MPRHTSLSTLEYTLMAFIALFAVGVLTYALWPMVEMILDGFKILGQAFNGNFVPLK